MSIGNFGINIVLARYFGQHHNLADYGAFWVLLELMFFLNGVQYAVVVYPLTVFGALTDRKSLGRMTTQSLLQTLLGSPLMIAALIVTAAIVHVPWMVGVWAGVAVFFWQLQETTRRGLMSHLRFAPPAWATASAISGSSRSSFVSQCGGRSI